MTSKRDIENRRIPLGPSDFAVEFGDHVGHFFETRSEWLEVLVPFLRLGLERGEKCVYLLPGGERETELVEALRVARVPVGEALESRQLVIVTDPPSSASLRSLLTSAGTEVATERYSGLRWGGEMTWIASLPRGDTLVEWESYCNEVNVDRVIFLCQYELRSFAGSAVMDALETHPLCIVRSAIHHNPYFVQPAERPGADHGPPAC